MASKGPQGAAEKRAPPGLAQPSPKINVAPTMFGVKLGDSVDQLPKCKGGHFEKEGPCRFSINELSDKSVECLEHLQGAEKARMVAGTKRNARFELLEALFSAR
jgi:hypothetical protein